MPTLEEQIAAASEALRARVYTSLFQLTSEDNVADTKSLFVYGTLMYPSVLKCVIQNDSSHLEICPATLPSHCRYRVKGCDYPAVITRRETPSNGSVRTASESHVKGMIIRGLTRRDLALIEQYEGNEYVMNVVVATPTAAFQANSELIDKPS